MLQAALEFYAAEDCRGIGPILVGSMRLKAATSLRWTIGAVFTLYENRAE
jgi:hypothetical protein